MVLPNAVPLPMILSFFWLIKLIKLIELIEFIELIMPTLKKAMKQQTIYSTLQLINQST